MIVVTPTAHGGALRSAGGYGITADVPADWQVQVRRGALVASTTRLPPATRPVGPALHQRLGPDDLGVLLFEDAPPVDRGVYRSGYPRPFSRPDFGPPPLGGTNPGKHSFARRNFTVAGRFFDLFVESGSTRPTPTRIVQLNELVRSLSIRPGDFYPGKAAPARFRAAPGWTTRNAGTAAVGPSTYSMTLAATIQYRDALNEFPPHRTLEALPADGVVIWLSLSADNRDPPTVPEGNLGRPVLRVGRSACGSFEGAPPDVLTCSLRAWRPRRYHIFGWTIFGQRRPSASQLAEARAELDRLVLPKWPLWPAS